MREDLPCLRFFDFLDCSQHVESGIVHNNVDVPMYLPCLRYHGNNVFRVGHVQGEDAQSIGRYAKVGLPVAGRADDEIALVKGSRCQLPSKAW